MAASSPDFPPTAGESPAAAWACVPAVLAALLLAAPFALGPAAAEITLEAESSDFDRRNERLVFREVRIQPGRSRRSLADDAESRDLDFSRGSWLFRGNVQDLEPDGQHRVRPRHGQFHGTTRLRQGDQRPRAHAGALLSHHAGARGPAR
jgi:hypothetical protein